MDIRDATALWQLLAYLNPERIEAVARLLADIPLTDTDHTDTPAHAWQSVLHDIPLPAAIEAVIEWHRTHPSDELIGPGDIIRSAGAQP